MHGVVHTTKATIYSMAVLIAFVFLMPMAWAASEIVPVEMREALVGAGGNWSDIEPFLSSLSPQERNLVIETYPERLAELEEIRKAVNETGAQWTPGLTPIFLLPPDKRGGAGTSPIPLEAGGVSKEVQTVESSERMPPAGALPASWDWRNVDGSDWTTSVKNQGACGSCWAFGAIGTIESRVKIMARNANLQPDLSEQSLLSCSPGDCVVGWYTDATANWITCQGTVDESCFPYQASDSVPCFASCPDRNSRDQKIEGWNWVCDNWYTVDVDRIKQEILSRGPVSAYFEVYQDFDAYIGGIYTHTWGNFRGGHDVPIVGWGSEGGVDYWICKNSWGTGHGENGWFKIKMGEVEIGTQAISYGVKKRGKVLFYEGHNPMTDFRLSDKYAEWGSLLARNGYIVHSSSTSPLTSDLLNCYDVVIISNPSVSFTSSELNCIRNFVGQGRVIAAGDGNLFDKTTAFIYKQDNERMAVEYIDWLSTGEGKGLFVMGEHGGFSNNANANQIAQMFGMKFNLDVIYDNKRYDTNTYWPILGPEDDVVAVCSCSVSTSVDAIPLARATSSGYVASAIPRAGANSHTSIISTSVGMNESVPPSGAGISFTGPVGIAAVDLGRKGEDNIGLFMPSTARWKLDYDNNGASDFQVTWGASTDIPVAGDWIGDGKDRIGLFRPSTARWYLDYDNNGASDFQVNWGASTDIPVTGDWIKRR